MLAIEGKPGRLCDGPSRRELLTVGSVSLLGLSLPEILRHQATAAANKKQSGGGFGRAQSVLMLYLQGSPSHIDIWDPKPDAPVEFRGEFKPIASKAPGLFLGEVLPHLARQADKFTLLRSLGVKPRGLTNHGASIYMLLTGHDPGNFTPTGLAVPPSKEDLPSVGSLVARYRPADRGALGYVALCGPVKEGVVTGVGQYAGLLGTEFNPYQMYDDPTLPLHLDGFALPPDVTLGRMKGRLDLRGVVAPSGRLGPREFDGHYGKALSLLESARAERAFRLDQEPPTIRDRYGPSRFGQCCLLARRLIEAGTRFVQVNWPAGSDTEPMDGLDGSWDTHRNNFPMLRNWRCPVFDRAAATLLEDLSDRGLLESTLVLMVGEFGRSPKIGSPTTNNVGPGGRDHWPSCYTALLAGGGIRPGQVYGESDRYGAHPKTNPVHPYDLIATVYHALGMDLATTYRDTLNRPRGLVEHGGPIYGLF
jgi:hypothetical protein